MTLTQIKAAMHEALHVRVSQVDRPTPIKGVTETWLEVTYRGRHIGWLPADTDPNLAITTARRWLQQNRQIEKDSKSNPMPPAAGLILQRLAEETGATGAKR